MSNAKLNLKLNGFPVSGYPKLISISPSQSAIHATLEIPAKSSVYDVVKSHVWDQDPDTELFLEGEVFDKKKKLWFDFKIKGLILNANISETTLATFQSSDFPERWEEIASRKT